MCEKEKERQTDTQAEQEGRYKSEQETLVWHVSDRTRITTQAGSSSCRDVGISYQHNSSVKHISHYNCLFFDVSKYTDSKDKFVQI